MVVRNWTILKGYLDGEKTIIEVSQFSIIVNTPKSKTQIRIPREDFEKVWRIWRDYSDRWIDRQQIRDLTFYSKYIISILHGLLIETH
jgi:hypothetical protein